MTSRTLDVHCSACRQYLCSLSPSDYEWISKTFYCTLKSCKEEATLAALQGKDVKIVK